MRDLLIKSEVKRLGSRAGACDVKNHLFFKGTQWALLRNIEPPIKPALSRSGGEKKGYPDGIGLCNFRDLSESDPVDFESELLMDDCTINSNPFHDFETLQIDRS